MEWLRQFRTEIAPMVRHWAIHPAGRQSAAFVAFTLVKILPPEASAEAEGASGGSIFAKMKRTGIR
ncbi:MAG: hypothetical protein CFE33_06890 [Pseudorhodobacter sp. PARRP1]|nr:MAG: hypothetical protein CFE33_06890 [Pseudorhodobacter sp. PARRP1]